MLPDHSGGASEQRSFSPVQRILERLTWRFDDVCPDLCHVISIASDIQHLLPPPPRRHCRLVPSPWGMRRDEYFRRREARADEATSTFRQIAADAATYVLATPRLPWSRVLPGSLAHVIGEESPLYLADYWTIALHHLVWSRQLPYMPKVRWLKSDSVDIKPFSVVSRLPVDLREASIEALILLQERVGRYD